MDNSKNNNENEDNCCDIHGSAKYDPTNEDIHKTKPASKKHMKPFKFKIYSSFSNTLVIGPVGIGKGAAITQIGKLKIPNILTYESSIFVFDMHKNGLIAENTGQSDFTIQDCL